MNGSNVKRTTLASKRFYRVTGNQNIWTHFEALFGGRTNAMKLYHKVADGAKVRYYDFTSLYPTVYSQKTVSVWTPQINNRDFGSLDKYFGFVKFDVLPQEVYSILSCPIGVTKKKKKKKNSCTRYVRHVPRS